MYAVRGDTFRGHTERIGSWTLSPRAYFTQVRAELQPLLKTGDPLANQEGHHYADEVIHEFRRLRPADLAALVELLIAVVDDGASIGFLPPLSPAEATMYWQHALEPGTLLLAGYEQERLLGSVQVQLALRANARHRAEVAKLMVHPAARRQGLGRRLMLALENVARREGRSLLVLDTRAGDPSNALYRQLGYIEAGQIPRYARSASGQLDGTVFYYKEL